MNDDEATALAGTTHRVVVIGGGMAGLAAAHELAERGLAVTVLERRERVGGKAVSYDEPAGGTTVPSEHGFRFYPGFYRHVPDTMARIPDAAGTATVADHLVVLSQAWLTADGGGMVDITMPTGDRPVTATLDRRLQDRLRDPDERVRIRELARFVVALFGYWAAGEEDRDRLDEIGWCDFIGVDERSGPLYRMLFADGLSRSFVATRASEMSARTGAAILLQLLWDMVGEIAGRDPADRVLDGPTSAVWIDPWRTLLAADLGVRFVLDAVVDTLVVGREPAAITEIHLVREGAAERLRIGEHFDHVVLATPVDETRRIVAASPTLHRRSPSFSRIDDRRPDGAPGPCDPDTVDRTICDDGRLIMSSWMSGLTFHADSRAGWDLPHGHILCAGTDWALTAVDHRLAWEGADSTAPPVLAVIISDWCRPDRVSGRSAAQSPLPDLVAVVWRQLHDALPPGAIPATPPAVVTLDREITLPTAPGGSATNGYPMLVNTRGAWAARPPAGETGVANLVLAGDWVRTVTDFASMEAANEAGRRAANATLDAIGHDPADRAFVADRLPEPEFPFVDWGRRALQSSVRSIGAGDTTEAEQRYAELRALIAEDAPGASTVEIRVAREVTRLLEAMAGH